MEAELRVAGWFLLAAFLLLLALFFIDYEVAGWFVLASIGWIAGMKLLARAMDLG